MKILATIRKADYSETDADTFLVEATRQELGEIGNYYRYSGSVKKFGPGSKINVHEIYQFLHKMAEAVREFKKAKNTIAAVTDLLELPPSMVDVAEIKELP